MPEVAKRPRGRPRKQAISASEPVLLEAVVEPQITVWVYLARTMSDPREPIPVVWPRNWPLPQAGDNVIVDGKSGFVAYRQFDPDNNKLSIVTR